MTQDSVLKKILEDAGTIAIIGAKDNPGQPVDRVGRYLAEAGYKVIPVHPKRTGVWGLRTYKSVLEVPERIDIINVFRAPSFCLEHAEETLGLPGLPRLFWMQLGISSPQARELLADKGLHVVEDACIMVEHARMFKGGSLQHCKENRRTD